MAGVITTDKGATVTFIRPQPTAALSELHAQDEARGIKPLSFTPATGPPHPGSGPGLYIEPIDWRQQTPPAPERELVREDVERRPAKPKAKAPKPTPRLDAARAILEELRRP